MSKDVAIVGASGAVGERMRQVLWERNFPVGELRCFSSARSEGNKLRFGYGTVSSQVLTKGCFSGVGIAFFDASDEVSKIWVKEAAEAGAWVVDNSAAFRMDPEVPLGVPEVNAAELMDYVRRGMATPGDWKTRVIAGPNCSTAGLVVALQPLNRHWGIRRVIVSTYQSVSGAGKAAIEELQTQIKQSLNSVKLRRSNDAVFPHPIAYNCIPRIGKAGMNGYTSEETKLILETRKILGTPDLAITATAVRVPTLIGHGESVAIEFDAPWDAIGVDRIRTALEAQAGVVVYDDLARDHYPLNQVWEGDTLAPASGTDPVYVGRIRRDESVSSGAHLWLVSDNLRKGAATNAVQIGELLVAEGIL